MKDYVNQTETQCSSSELKQISKTKTLVAGIRYRPITLATIVKFLESNNLGTPRTIGEALRTSVETLETMVLHQSPACSFNTVEDAIAFLEDRDLFDRGTSASYKAKQTASLLSLEALREAKEEEEEFKRQHQEALKRLQQQEDASSCKPTFEDYVKRDAEQDYSPSKLREAFKQKPQDLIEEEKGE